jgi:hypothetical protein
MCTSPWGHSWTRPAFGRWRTIFVGSKAPWFEITDELPQFEEHAK